MLDAIRSYPSQLPRNILILEGMVKSGIASFVIGTFETKNVQVGMLSAGVAVTASLIHGLTTPFFRKFFSIDYDGEVKWYQTAIQTAASMGLSLILVNSFTHFRPVIMARCNPIVGALALICLNLGLNSSRTRPIYERPINTPMSYWIL